jgi:uncharacterized protein YcfL
LEFKASRKSKARRIKPAGNTVYKLWLGQSSIGKSRGFSKANFYQERSVPTHATAHIHNRCATYKQTLLMKKIFYLILSIFILTGCSNSDNIYVNSDLKNKIDLIIDSYQNFVSDKENNVHDPEVYEVYFSQIENECFITINTNYFYKTDLNGFMFIKNKLVTFNNVDSECNKNWIKINRTESTQKLTEYQTENEAFDNYSPAFWTFKIENGNLILDTQGKLKIDFNKK